MARLLQGQNISKSQVGINDEGELRFPNSKTTTVPKEILEKASKLKVARLNL